MQHTSEQMKFISFWEGGRIARVHAIEKNVHAIVYWDCKGGREKESYRDLKVPLQRGSILNFGVPKLTNFLSYTHTLKYIL